jgi:hypothetical protein
MGLSGLGLFFLSERGRRQLNALFEGVALQEGPLAQFNKFLDDRLARIQRALDEVAEALEAPSAYRPRSG